MAADAYRFIAPRGGLADEWVAELQRRIASRDDVVAVWWVTVLYVAEDPVITVDTLHFELAEPPDVAASTQAYRDLSQLVPGGGPPWSISPTSILEAVRDAGMRVV